MSNNVIKGLVAGLAIVVMLVAFERHAHAGQSSGVVIYTQTGCGGCETVKAQLRKAHVPFRECNVTNSSACSQQLDRLGTGYTPTLTKNGRVVSIGQIK